MKKMIEKTGVFNPMKSTPCSILYLLFFFSLFTSAAEAKKVTMAMTKLTGGSGVSANDVDLITDRLNAELFNTNTATIIERNQMDEILKEQGFQKSGACTDEGCLVEMGQLLGVEQIISGSLGKLGKIWIINLRVIDVQTGKIAVVVSREYAGGIEDLVGNLNDIALVLVGLKKERLKPRPDYGMLTIMSYPDSLPIMLNNKNVGTTPFENNMLKPGQVIISLDKEGFETFTDTLILKKGKATLVKAKLVNKKGRLVVSSSPDKARASLDTLSLGETPLTTDWLQPGEYTLVLEKDKFLRYRQKILVTKNVTDTLSCQLKPLSNKVARLIVFGLLSGGALGSGIYFNTRAQKYYSDEAAALAAYNESQSAEEFETNWKEYKKKTRDADTAGLIRSISYGVAGMFSIGLFLSIPF